MERLFTNQDSFQQHSLTYSPPLQTAKDSNVPNLSPPIPSPSLTPPHSGTIPTTTTTTHNNNHSIKKCLSDGITLLNQAGTDSQHRASLETTAALEQSLMRRLPPRKRMQSLKKQFTKPNLSVPVLSPSLTMGLVTAASPTQSYSSASTTSAYHSSNSDNTNTSRSPSPLINIEDDSGDTTETDDEDGWRLHRKRSISETTLLSDDFGRPKQTVIIQQQPCSASFDDPTSSVNTKLPPKPINSRQKPSLQSSLDQQASMEPATPSGRKTKTGAKKKQEEAVWQDTKEYPLTTDTATTSKRKTKKSDMHKSKAKKPTTLYCICQTPYDATRFMIACDQCDQWFHGECIGISEKDGEFIDLYFCSICGKDTGKKTSWKLQCENPTCHKSARVGASSSSSLPKYCSYKCNAAQKSRLELKDMEKDQQHLEQQIQRCMGTLRMIEQKQQFLDMTERQAQSYDICGFDSRLVWDNHLWIKVQRVVETEKDGTVILLFQQQQNKSRSSSSTSQQTWAMDTHRRCQHRRNDCRQHQQWPNILGLELKKERKLQLQAIKALEKEMDLANASTY